MYRLRLLAQEKINTMTEAELLAFLDLDTSLIAKAEEEIQQKAERYAELAFDTDTVKMTFEKLDCICVVSFHKTSFSSFRNIPFEEIRFSDENVEIVADPHHGHGHGHGHGGGWTVKHGSYDDLSALNRFYIVDNEHGILEEDIHSFAHISNQCDHERELFMIVTKRAYHFIYLLCLQYLKKGFEVRCFDITGEEVS